MVKALRMQCLISMATAHKTQRQSINLHPRINNRMFKWKMTRKKILSIKKIRSQTMAKKMPIKLLKIKQPRTKINLIRTKRKLRCKMRRNQVKINSVQLLSSRKPFKLIRTPLKRLRQTCNR